MLKGMAIYADPDPYVLCPACFEINWMPMPQEATCSRCGHLWTHLEQDILPKKSFDPYDAYWYANEGGDWSHDTGFVYLLVNKINRRIYVGVTRRGMHERMREYRSQSERVYLGQSCAYQDVVLAMADYGIDAFDMILLAEGGYVTEQRWIGRLKANDPKIGYNGRWY